MDNKDLPIVLLIVLFGGVAVWWILKNKTPAPPAAVKTPCNVSGGYQGVGLSVPCGELEKAVSGVLALPGKVLSNLPGFGGGSMPTSLKDQVDAANNRGVIWTSSMFTSGWSGAINPQPLPPGAKNAIVGTMVTLVNVSDGKPYSVGVWHATPTGTGSTVTPTSTAVRAPAGSTIPMRTVR